MAKFDRIIIVVAFVVDVCVCVRFFASFCRSEQKIVSMYVGVYVVQSQHFLII